ncbi:MAG TPA: HAD family hydrolase [Candidatus Saccharimonadaceae bacterium]|nr:HAD family hydrolase [Candidatus Saccharimonadaceae bacterium]
MRILVDVTGDTPAGSRLAHAARALAGRGHATWWRGAAPPDGVERAPTGAALSRVRVDVAIGGARAPWRTALAGWRAGARCLVLGLDRASVAKWSVVDRACWEGAHGAGLIDERDADDMRRDPLGLDLERLALWPPGPPGAADDPASDDAEVLERACERALARQRSRSLRPALFLDRDGTLVVEKGYLSDPNDLELLPGVGAALRAAHAAGFALVVISNQSGAGRGLFPLSRVYEAMARLRALLRAEGVELDAIYFCPHRPEAGCACRKPGTELLERAADDLQLSLRHSTMVGDKLLDAATGLNAGGRGVLLRTGYGRDEERRVGSAGEVTPDQVADDLPAAVAWVLEREEMERRD